MTTKFYIVIYPHPGVPPRHRIERLEIGSEVDGKGLLGKLCDIYPDQHDDLKDGTLWKASRSTVAQRSTSTLTSVTGLRTCYCGCRKI